MKGKNGKVAFMSRQSEHESDTGDEPELTHALGLAADLEETTSLTPAVRRHGESVE